jgi:hypothetical protein
VLPSICFATGQEAGTDPANDSFTFFAVAEPQGTATAGHLRMRQPLYLLDLCRQVKTGSLNRERVETLVGGPAALDALLAMDLDAIFETLTSPTPAGAVRSQRSAWYQILTNLETAPLPPLEPREPLDFYEVSPRDSKAELLQVTSPADGTIEARLPTDSPFRILSMLSYDGVIVDPTPVRSARRRPVSGRPSTEGPWPYRSPEMLRVQPPWVLPVEAGQDVDILVGLPVGAALPPDGISSTITLADPVQGLWRQDVPILAKGVPGDDNIDIRIDVPRHRIDVVSEPSYNPNVPRQVVVPLSVSQPYPQVAVKGTVQPLALPQGVTMQSLAFTLFPQQVQDVSFILSIDRQSTAWLVQSVPRNFSIKVSYQTLTKPVSSRSETVDFFFVVHPGSQSWYAKGQAGGVQCAQSLVLYSDGTLSRSGWCDNRNAFDAKVVSEGTLVLPKAVSDVYFMGWFDGPELKSSTITSFYFQNNYLFVRSQPLLMSWTRL